MNGRSGDQVSAGEKMMEAHQKPGPGAGDSTRGRSEDRYDEISKYSV